MSDPAGGPVRDDDELDRPDEVVEVVEWVEWVDDDDRVIEVVRRSRMRAENLRHRSVGIVVRSTDGRLLVHRRSATKDLLPGWWDVCAGGVVGVGEAYEAAAERELAEELGVTGVDLRPLGGGRFDSDVSREIARVYEVVHDGPFQLTDGEVAEIRLVTADELATSMAREPFLPACRALVLPLVDGFRHLGCVPEVGPVRSDAVHRIEFTVEPFVEGRPGPHVTEAIEAVRRLGLDVEVGPFGSACTVSPERSAEVVAAIVGAAFAHGADHVVLDVGSGGPEPGTST